MKNEDNFSLSTFDNLGIPVNAILVVRNGTIVGSDLKPWLTKIRGAGAFNASTGRYVVN